MSMDATLDWAFGGDQLLYQKCRACHRIAYFHRNFCSACGDASPTILQSRGEGWVYARTLIQRAPSDEFRAIVPYCIVLVDIAEGFRVMGHAVPSLVIGDAVKCTITTVVGRPLPFFSALPAASSSEDPHVT
jgi:uncharacterized OB-fold protein